MLSYIYVWVAGIGKRNGDNGGIPPSKLKQWGNFKVNGGFSMCGTVVIRVLVGGRDKFEYVRGGGYI